MKRKTNRLSQDIRTSLKQVAVFLTMFTKNTIKNTDGIHEFRVSELLYRKIDLLREDNALSEYLKKKIPLSDEVIQILKLIENDFSLRRILLRKLESIKERGELISRDELIEKNLFKKERFDYIGWLDTSRLPNLSHLHQE